MMWMKLFPICLGLIAVTACKTKKQAVPDASVRDEVGWQVRYQSGPCFGTCPVYIFYLLDSAKALLHVKAYFLEPGWYAADMPAGEVRALLTELNRPECWVTPSDEGPEIADLPSRYLVYFTRGEYRSTQITGAMIPALSRVTAGLNRMIDLARWSPTELRPIPWAPHTSDIIVQLAPDVNIDAWIDRHRGLGVSVKRVISRRTGHYLIALSADGPEPNDVLQHIRLEDDVIGAQWDHPLTPRKR